MKRSIYFMLALVVVCFAIAVATDLIDAWSDRTDRRLLILSVGGIVLFAGLGLGSSEEVNDGDESLTGRAAAAHRLRNGRPDPASLPTKPGSLLKKDPPAIGDADTATAAGLDVDQLDLATSESAEAPFVDAPETAAIESEAAPFVGSTNEPNDAPETDTPQPDPVRRVIASANDHRFDDDTFDDNTFDEALLELIDDEQMLEIGQLLDAAEERDETRPTDTEVVLAHDSVEPLTRLELRLADYDDEDLQRVVKESEAVVIAEMVRSGQLSSEGELTEQDIASMVFLAYTSDEMLDELRLRKSMDSTLPLSEAAAPLDIAAEEPH